MRPIQDTYPADFEPVEDGTSRIARLRRGFSTAVGACIALALLVAVGMWLYRLGVRDAENVPIIRAAAAPAKVRPDDPGGAVAPHQDITSYRVAESGPAHASTAVIAPPPPEPRDEDVPMGALAPEPVERPEAAVTAPAVIAPIEAAPVPAPAPTPVEAAAAIASGEVRARTQSAAADAADVLVTGEVLALAAPDADVTGAAAATLPAQPADPIRDASEYAPPLSPVAPRRPEDLKARMAAAVQAAEQSATDLARRAAESEIQVQLAADPSEDTIRTMWRRISQSNSDILHDRELAVQTTISGGTRFYRLRVGPFSGASEARAVCQALRARGQDCIVARNG